MSFVQATLCKQASLHNTSSISPAPFPSFDEQFNTDIKKIWGFITSFEWIFHYFT
jgi:hypothetical protein